MTESIRKSFVRQGSTLLRIWRWHRHANTWECNKFFHHFFIKGRCSAGNITTTLKVCSVLICNCIWLNNVYGNNRCRGTWIFLQPFVEDVNHQTQQKNSSERSSDYPSAWVCHSIGELIQSFIFRTSTWERQKNMRLKNSLDMTKKPGALTSTSFSLADFVIWCGYNLLRRIRRMLLNLKGLQTLKGLSYQSIIQESKSRLKVHLPPICKMRPFITIQARLIA